MYSERYSCLEGMEMIQELKSFEAGSQSSSQVQLRASHWSGPSITDTPKAVTAELSSALRLSEAKRMLQTTGTASLRVLHRLHPRLSP